MATEPQEPDGTGEAVNPEGAAEETQELPAQAAPARRTSKRRKRLSPFVLITLAAVGLLTFIGLLVAAAGIIFPSLAAPSAEEEPLKTLSPVLREAMVQFPEGFHPIAVNGAQFGIVLMEGNEQIVVTPIDGFNQIVFTKMISPTGSVAIDDKEALPGYGFTSAGLAGTIDPSPPDGQARVFFTPGRDFEILFLVKEGGSAGIVWRVIDGLGQPTSSEHFIRFDCARMTCAYTYFIGAQFVKEGEFKLSNGGFNESGVIISGYSATRAGEQVMMLRIPAGPWVTP